MVAEILWGSIRVSNLYMRKRKLRALSDLLKIFYNMVQIF